MESLEEAEESMPNPSGIVLKGVYFDLSTAIESTMDIIAMLCKDFGIMPRGDYENISALREKKFINEELAESLAKCNGMRNFIVHQYNGINKKLVLDSFFKVKKNLLKFVKIVEASFDEN
ncbi:MAG: DUF86 domain-containing protein [Candidatus Lokiarchaeota archaeon]|nr:DUF86 domain-containing protein [Candidatus Lokiarchaeota archaeon]